MTAFILVLILLFPFLGPVVIRMAVNGATSATGAGVKKAHRSISGYLSTFATRLPPDTAMILIASGVSEVLSQKTDVADGRLTARVSPTATIDISAEFRDGVTCVTSRSRTGTSDPNVVRIHGAILRALRTQDPGASGT